MYLVNYLPILLSWKSEVLCSGISLRTRAEYWDQCSLVLGAWIGRALGIDFGNS